MVDCVRQLFQSRGDSQYGGEAVSQMEHALQAAAMAEADGAAPETVTAALLHDIGHLLHDLDNDAPDRGIDDVHEELADRWLVGLFPQTVTEPIRLHVEAKRYLCTVDETYRSVLSAPSIQSLELQGGNLNEQQVRQFESHPLFEQIVAVRRYDDRAKIEGLETPGLEHFLEAVAACVELSDGVGSDG